MVYQGVAVLPDGLELAYADSGPVSGSSNYTTLILVHGCAFNAHTFERLHERATTFNLRTIAFQRPDYPGSTPFTDNEIAEIREGNEKYLANAQKMMVDFIRYVVKTLEIPVISNLGSVQKGEGISGGLVLVGWSLGAYIPLSVLADPKVVNPEMHGVLEKYLRSVIVYDSPPMTFGIPIPPANPVAGDPTTAAPKPSDFPISITSFFDQPNGWAGDVEAMDRRFAAEKAMWYDWTEEQRNKYVTTSTLMRCEFPTLVEPMQTHFRNNAQKALYDETLAQEFLPNISIGVISVGRSFWHCRWGIWHMEQTYRAKLNEGKKLRKLKAAHLRECNHLAHLENPTLFLDTVKSLI
ncbi:Alpha/Beta hydrolase protein [Crepidotus variabilis]|uniref:Alpha/Beta hydrolase protein n=1 Tax=Crepidotus variabilis TaxID=179855 RepID=A0A9P6EEY5_9AGAR|nr:Alpha/Beta hydrolase protein [Crepidotus variabilis]